MIRFYTLVFALSVFFSGSSLVAYAQLTTGLLSPALEKIDSKTPSPTITHYGYSGVTSRQWQSRISGSYQWTDIRDAKDVSYSPGLLRFSTEFRVKLNDDDIYTPVSIISLGVTPGYVTPEKPTIRSNQAVPTLTHVGHVDVVSRQWQESSGSTWIDIPGATGITYSPGVLTGSSLITYKAFRVKVTPKGEFGEYSLMSSIFVLGTNNTINPLSQTIEPGEKVTTLSASLTGQIFSWQWQKSTDEVNWTDIPKATVDYYLPEALTETTYFRVRLNETEIYTSVAAVIVVNPEVISSGTITPDVQTAIAGNPPQQLNHVEYGNITYRQWQISFDDVIWEDIAGATGKVYSPQALVRPCSFRILTNQGYSNIATIQVKVEPRLDLNWILSKTYTEKDNASSESDLKYFDGLGYPTQIVNVGASPQKYNNIITPIEYDNMRRSDARLYLPYTTTKGISQSESIGSQKIYYSSKFGDSQYSFVENVFSSSMNRVERSYNVGKAFREGDEKYTEYAYGSNIKDQVYIIKSVDDGKGFSIDSYYDENSLFKNTEINEDGLIIESYNDFKGKTILKRNKADDITLNTYYVYDDMGRMTWIISPEGMNKLSQGAPMDSVAKHFCYNYQYDGRNRLICKRIPGRGEELYVYDKADRLVLMQDAELRKNCHWIYNVYDSFGRTVCKSIIKDNNAKFLTQDRLQARYDAPDFDNSYPVLGNATNLYCPFNDMSFVVDAKVREVFYGGAHYVPGDDEDIENEDKKESRLKVGKENVEISDKYLLGFSKERAGEYLLTASDIVELTNIHELQGVRTPIIYDYNYFNGDTIRPEYYAGSDEKLDYYYLPFFLTWILSDQRIQSLYSELTPYRILDYFPEYVPERQYVDDPLYIQGEEPYDRYNLNLDVFIHSDYYIRVDESKIGKSWTSIFAEHGYEFLEDSTFNALKTFCEISTHPTNKSVKYYYVPRMLDLILKQTYYDYINAPDSFDFGVPVDASKINSYKDFLSIYDAYSIVSEFPGVGEPRIFTDLKDPTHCKPGSDESEKDPIKDREMVKYDIPSHLSFVDVPEVTVTPDPRNTGLLIYEKDYIIDDRFYSKEANYTECAYYYDYKGRIIQAVEKNHLGYISRFSLKYSFSGDPLVTVETHQISENVEDILETRFTYDNRGRLLKDSTCLNGGSWIPMKYDYNDLGRLISTTYGDSVVTEGYKYNIQGWLTQKKSDKFTMDLRYFDPKKDVAPSYTGNITEWEWQHKDSDLGETPVNAYAFTYDKLDRLVDSNHYEDDKLTNRFTERYIYYDQNGNITHLYREGANDGYGFGYEYSGNQLVRLWDKGNGEHDYTYDSNGNLLTDGRRGLKFEYNFLDLVSKVTSCDDDSQKAHYIYSSSGSKLGVKGAGKELQYLGSFVYEQTKDGLKIENVRFSGGGIVRTDTDNGDHFEPNFFLTDHLGSVRQVIDGSGNVISTNDYYPFGKRWSDKLSLTAASNKFLYNGAEAQDNILGIDDLGLLDYGFRQYDPHIGRWFVPDPLAELFPGISPYAYALNNPVRYVDFFGLAPGSPDEPIDIEEVIVDGRRGPGRPPLGGWDIWWASFYFKDHVIDTGYGGYGGGGSGSGGGGDGSGYYDDDNDDDRKKRNEKDEEKRVVGGGSGSSGSSGGSGSKARKMIVEAMAVAVQFIEDKPLIRAAVNVRGATIAPMVTVFVFVLTLQGDTGPKKAVEAATAASTSTPALPDPNDDHNNKNKEFKKRKSNQSHKEAKDDVPDWAKGNKPYKGENGRDFAKRLLDEKYGKINHKQAPKSDFNRIKKWGDSAFE